MQRWKEEFVAYTQRKCVHIHNNGDYEHGKVLYLEPDWSYLDFLNAASNRLQMGPAAKRCFNSDGVEINDCMMIEDDDMLFLSPGEDFLPPFDQSIEIDDGDSNKVEGEKLPHSIGGYKTGELLGRGGFGEVRVGEHHITGEKVALKFLRKADIHSLVAAERTNTEIQCLMALKHNNIIRLQQQLESQHHVVLVFELMEGGDLLKYLLQRQQVMKAPKANLTEDEARHVFYQVLSAVSYAHNQHICHRDLKLENILLKDTTLSVVKIADFGLSDFYRPGAVMKSSCGTLSFLAPEVFKGTANAGPPLDVWAMGVILFALLCGRLPFEGPDLNGTKRPREAVIKSRIMKGQYTIDDNLGTEAKDLLRRLLQSDPLERITIPELFNHAWIRAATSIQFVDLLHQHQLAHHSFMTGTVLPHSSSVAAGHNSLAGCLSPSVKGRNSAAVGVPTASSTSNKMTLNLQSVTTDNSNTIIEHNHHHNNIPGDEESLYYDPLKGHLVTPTLSPTSSGSSKHIPSSSMFPPPTSTNNYQHIEQVSPAIPSRRRSRTMDLPSVASNLHGNILVSLESPRGILSPQSSGDKNSIFQNIHHSPNNNNSTTANVGAEAPSTSSSAANKSTFKLIPLRRNNSNVASHQNSSSDLLNISTNNNNNSSNFHSAANNASSTFYHHEHGELPSLANRLSNSSQHSVGIAQLLGTATNAVSTETANNSSSNIKNHSLYGYTSNANYNNNNNYGDDSSVVSTASAPSSQPPRGSNRPSTVTTGNRGRNIINSIVKEDAQTIILSPPSGTLLDNSPYTGSTARKNAIQSQRKDSHPRSVSTGNNVNSSNNSNHLSLAKTHDATDTTTSKYARSPASYHGSNYSDATNNSNLMGSHSNHHSKRVVSTSAVTTSPTTTSNHTINNHNHNTTVATAITSGSLSSSTATNSTTLLTPPPSLSAIGSQRSQSSMSSSNLIPPTFSPSSPRETPSSAHVHSASHHHGTQIASRSTNSHQLGHNNNNNHHNAHNNKGFNTITVGSATSTGKTRFL